jgi:hypothetical protein
MFVLSSFASAVRPGNFTLLPGFLPFLALRAFTTKRKFPYYGKVVKEKALEF